MYALMGKWNFVYRYSFLLYSHILTKGEFWILYILNMQYTKRKRLEYLICWWNHTNKYNICYENENVMNVRYTFDPYLHA